MTFLLGSMNGSLGNDATVLSPTNRSDASTRRSPGRTRSRRRSDDWFVGSNRSDRLRGDDQDNIMDGQNGRDFMNGNDGDDVILGGNGRDVMNGGSGDDILRGGKGADEMIGADGNDFLSGSRGRDRIFGGSGDDVLKGGRQSDFLQDLSLGSNILLGNRGNDVLVSGEGTNILDGGAGFDTADYRLLEAAITLLPQGTLFKTRIGIDQLDNIEKIIGSAGFENRIDASSADSASLNVDLSQNQLEVTIEGIGQRNFTVENFIHVLGSDLGDVITGNDGDNQLVGNGGDDLLSGGAGSDRLNGYGGGVEYDRLAGGSGADTFVLGTQGDRFYEGLGFATISDFNRAEGDVIQLQSRISDYTYRPGSSGGIVIRDQDNDLIAFVSNVNVASDLVVSTV